MIWTYAILLGSRGVLKFCLTPQDCAITPSVRVTYYDFMGLVVLLHFLSVSCQLEVWHIEGGGA